MVSFVMPRQWTRTEYDQMVGAGLLREDERVQLIEGAILQMTPQYPSHAQAIQLVADSLRAAFRGSHMVRIQVPLAMGDFSEPEPDVAVVSGVARDYRDAHPTTAVLVVEIADSSLMFDRQCKARLYARHGIAEYWIVNLTSRCLEVYREPHAGDDADFIDPAIAATCGDEAPFDQTPFDRTPFDRTLFDRSGLDPSWLGTQAPDLPQLDGSRPYYAQIIVIDAAGRVAPLACPDARIAIADLLP